MARVESFALYVESNGSVDFSVHAGATPDPGAVPYVSHGQTRDGGRALEIIFTTTQPTDFDPAKVVAEMLSVLSGVSQDAPDLRDTDLSGTFATVEEALSAARAVVLG